MSGPLVVVLWLVAGILATYLIGDSDLTRTAMKWQTEGTDRETGE